MTTLSGRNLAFDDLFEVLVEASLENSANDAEKHNNYRTRKDDGSVVDFLVSKLHIVV